VWKLEFIHCFDQFCRSNIFIVKQLTHSQVHNHSHKKELIIIADGLHDIANLGMLFRVCEAFGVNSIVMANASVDIKSAKLKRVSRSTIQNVEYREVADIIPVIESMKSDGVKIVGLEVCDKSSPIQEYDWSQVSALALVIGHENFGISQPILDLCDEVVHISMFGKNSSINVIQASSIALYEITRE